MRPTAVLIVPDSLIPSSTSDTANLLGHDAHCNIIKHLLQ